MTIEGKGSAFREPWFWVVFAPLFLVVCVSAVLLSFAIVGADDRVYDDYYKQGRMINYRFEEEQNAIALSLRGEVSLSDGNTRLTVELAGRADPDTLTIDLSHPAKAQLDHSLVAERKAPGRYDTVLPDALEGRWYLLVSAEETDESVPWRISTEIDTQTATRFKFHAHQ